MCSEFPSCKKDLPKQFINAIHKMAEAWANDSTRPRLRKDVVESWDTLLTDWANDKKLPLLIRKTSKEEGRGCEVNSVLADRRVLIPADNSPAHWSFVLAWRGEMPDINQVRKWMKDDKIPIAWIFHKDEKEKAKHRGAHAEVRDISGCGWKVCHKNPIGLKRRGSISKIDIEELKNHFKNFLSPSNLFVVPKALGGLGELEEFIKVFRKHEKFD